MKNYKLIIVLLFTFTGFISAQQQGDYSKEPGYYDWGNLASLKSGDMLTEVYLEEPLLKMVAKMGDTKNEGLGDMIGSLKLVKVNEFMVDRRNFGKLEDSFNALNKDLHSKNWVRIIKAKHGDSNVNVYVKNGTNDEFVGLLLAISDKDGKVTLVNIVGKIDMDTIGKLSEHFHFPDVNKMKADIDEKDKDDK